MAAKLEPQASSPVDACEPASAASRSRQRWPLPSSWLTRSERDLLALSTVLKLLLWPCYHSTDFEVHRNWLAITYTLPIRDWYFEATSQWTLDYPPFFAYFSWILAQPAPFVDPLIVSLHEGLEYAAWPAKAYMRSTVIATELVLAAALVAHSRIGTQRLVKSGLGDESAPNAADPSLLLAASLFLHPGLIIIDHIHFQYNGFLFGVLLWSLWAAREDRSLLCAFLFSCLLNLKHIYMYIAPSFFVYLLRVYIFPPGSTTADLAKAFERLIILGAVTLAPFALSLLPLILDGAHSEAGSSGVLSQMVSRLFPFSRGLIHAYWAPNSWALWAFADRVLVKLLQRRPGLIGLLPHGLATKFHLSASHGFSSASRGLVGHVSFSVLPDIPPPTCFLMTVTCMLAYLLKLWQAPTYRSFLASISLCGFASFLFGWHVHEKAIMLVLIPYTFLAAEDYAHFRTFAILSTAGIVSLFPLLYEAAETPIKLAVTLLWSLVVFGSLSKRVYRPVTSNLGIAVHALETAYLYGFVLLQLYVSVLHPLLFPAVLHASPTASTPSTVSAAIHAAAATPSIVTVAAATAAVEAEAVQTPLWTPATAEKGTGEMEAPTAASAVAGTSNASAATDDEDGSQLEALGEASVVVEVEAALTEGGQRPTEEASSDLLSPPSPLPTLARAAVPPLSASKDGDTAAAALTESAMEFLPLMMVSVYCSVGVVWAWLRASSLYLSGRF
ncbi:glycosyl transferase [Thecaphora frezii]